MRVMREESQRLQVAIHHVVPVQLLQREQDGHMSDWYQCPEHGWRQDIAKAEAIGKNRIQLNKLFCKL